MCFVRNDDITEHFELPKEIFLYLHAPSKELFVYIPNILTEFSIICYIQLRKGIEQNVHAVV